MMIWLCFVLFLAFVCVILILMSSLFCVLDCLQLPCMMRFFLFLLCWINFINNILNLFHMNKELFKLIFKILVYILTAVAGFFGVSTLASCSTSRDVVVRGRAVIVTTDSTFVDHNRNFDYHVSYSK